MSETVDLSFVDRIPEILARQEHRSEILRRCLRGCFKWLKSDVKSANQYLSDLIKSGADVTDELQELENYGLSLQLQARAFRGYAERLADKPTQFWTE